MPRNIPLPAASPPRRPAGVRVHRLMLLAAATTLATLMPLQGPAARGDDLFAAQPLEQSRFAILARPVSRDDWNLLVLEQLAAAPRCWTSRPDGLIDPTLNRFNFSGICSRYIDSNGYSLRIGERDLASEYRLRLVQVADELRLLASTVSSPTDLVVGRGRVPLRDRDAFVMLALEPGWSLQRRSYQGRGLSHIYFSNSDSLPVLLARLQPDSPTIAAGDPASGDRRNRLLSRLGNLGSTPDNGGSSFGYVADRAAVAIPGRPVPLQVIPFRE